jgi:glycosyltransferase involved in cell wall biosynthesis
VKKEQLRILYAIQNVGGIDFSRDIGDTVPVKHTLKGLQRAGHLVHCINLKGRSVRLAEDATRLGYGREVPSGLSGAKPFKFMESGVRRLQRILGLPYFAFFDSYRFYGAVSRLLPGYDLCHEHNGLFCAGAALACARRGSPYILTFSADPLFELELVGKPLRGGHARVAAREARFTYRQARKILCVSQAARQHLIEVWQVDPEKIVIMPNGVDVQFFGQDCDPRPARARIGLDGAPVASFVGGFQAWHGIEGLVESFAKVLPQFPAARLLLVGDGPARPQVEKRIQELGMEAAVVITGLVPQTEIPEILSAVDVAVIPYPQLPKELWFSPLKLYEYMAAGKAIVASRSGQIAEVLQDGYNGLLVQPGELDELAQAMLRLFKNPPERQRLGENAKRQAVERHSWEQYVRRIEDVYRSVL